MKLTWLIGIEGSGHHMLRDLLVSFITLPSLIDKGAHYPLWLQRWDVTQVALPSCAVQNTLEEILLNYRTAGITTIFEDTSFPFGPPEVEYAGFISGPEQRGPLRKPDILEMLALMKGLADVKILVLYRSPISTVNSVLQRGFSTNLHFECKSAEATHLGIVSALAQVPPAIYRTVHFEAFVQEPQRHLDALADWWNIPRALLEGAGAVKLKQPTQLAEIEPERRARLEAFFTAERVQQWLPQYHSNPLLP